MALVSYIAADVFTFTYFHPRNDILILSEQLPGDITLHSISVPLHPIS